MLNLDFSKSLLGVQPGKLPEIQETSSFVTGEQDSGLARPKDVILSNGSRITLSPKEDKGVSDFDGTDLSDLLDIGRLRRKVELEHKLAEQDPPRQFTKRQPGLWTEKYRPQNFFELLGNERTNRRVLEWLNDWNEAVFKRANPRKEQQDPETETRNEDPLHRPYRKILLLHGPPGTGKTSIAHVIGKQLGYEVAEINASDERAGEAVRDKVRNSMQNASLSGKPVCLVIDEVDGASEFGFVRNLLDLIYEDRRATQNYGAPKSEKRNSKRKPARMLKRPIIAICNDVYAPSLDKLRPHCEVVSFRKASGRQIKARLRKICERESLGLNEKLVDAVVAATSGDVRSCINFLQFHGSDSDSLENSGKDTQVAWYLLLTEIFRRNPHVTKQQQLQKLRDAMAASPANLDRISAGCFNAMLDSDGANLKKLDDVSDWLFFQDTVGNKLRSSELSYYGSVAPTRFFERFNEVEAIGAERLSFKSRDEYFDTKKVVYDVLTRLRRNINLQGIPKNSLACEAPMLNAVVAPTALPLRRFVTDESRVAHALQVVRSLGLQFESHFANSERQINYQQNHKVHELVPNVAVFLKDGDAANQNLYIQRLQVAQTKSRERERVREELVRKRKAAEERDGGERKKAASTMEYFRTKYNAMSDTLSHKKEGRKEEEKVMGSNENRIWVKYHEGFSNAVRKEITWDMLF